MNSNGIFHAHQSFGMNRHFVKTSVVMILSSVLLYYSVAWVVLRCFHDIDETGTETAVSDSLHQRHFASSHVQHPNADIDCMGLNYHTETLAGSSAPLQVRSLTAMTSQVPGSFAVHNIGELAVENRWLRALSDRGSTLTFPTDLPRYLSVSALRI